MLGMKSFSKEYIAACRARVARDVEAYKAVQSLIASKEFETTFFNSQIMLLDYMFVHRLSGIEGKDGNPLNEVRVLCNSILYNAGRLQIEKLAGWPNSAVSSLKLPPEHSVLKMKLGDPIKLTEGDFSRLSAAFFDELERRYS